MTIELVPTDILIKELLGRFDHAVFAGAKILDQDEKGENGTIYERKQTEGNTRVCQGLAFGLMLYAQEGHDERSKPSEGDALS